jgi:dephospho-CoA kinase
LLMQNKQDKKKLLIGITGGIGSGKSLACIYFEKLGCKIFYADDIAKELYVSNRALRNKLVKHFGKRILDKTGNIDFFEFRKVVFSSTVNQQRVNSIVHPFVIDEIIRKSKIHKSRLIIIEAALIFESGFNKYLDYTIMVSSTVKNRIDRIRKRNELSLRVIRSIMKLQMPEKEKLAKADFVIKNDSAPPALQKKVNFLHTVLNNLN